MSASQPGPAGDQNRKSKWGGWIRIVVSFSLLALLFSRIDAGQLVSVLKNARVEIVAVVLLLEIALRLFVAFRWRVLLKKTHPSFGFPDAVRVTFVANFLGQFLPGWVGIEAVRIYGMAKRTLDFAGSFTSVFMDRVFGMLSILVVACAGLYFAPEGLHPDIKILVWGILLLAIVSITVLFHPVTRQITEAVLPAGVMRLIGSKLGKLYTSIDEYKAWPATLVWSLLLATLFQVFRILVAYTAAIAIGVNPPILEFAALFPIVMLLVLLPISIAGLGIREVSFVYFYSTFGVMDEVSALAVSIVIFLSGLISTLPGAYFYGRKRQPAP